MEITPKVIPLRLAFPSGATGWVLGHWVAVPILHMGFSSLRSGQSPTPVASSSFPPNWVHPRTLPGSKEQTAHGLENDLDATVIETGSGNDGSGFARMWRNRISTHEHTWIHAGSDRDLRTQSVATLRPPSTYGLVDWSFERRIVSCFLLNHLVPCDCSLAIGGALLFSHQSRFRPGFLAGLQAAAAVVSDMAVREGVPES
ncbi:hypothetical protein BGW80DRAFT_1248795 [Lactifluus volemus]|nr:hypothetical protein BGW80DRAFT_1248795 [Lactifluus volemus]